MKVIVDNKIPYIKEAIQHIANEVVFAPGSDFTPELVKDADALIIRTRTICNRALLEGSKVQFIATATIGYDHIDTEYCRNAGITWTNAPGCNANSVAEYIESTLMLLIERRGLQPKNLTMGIIGVGNVGSKVVEKAKKLGMRVLQNDPPRADKEGHAQFCTLQDIAEKCDIITFHTPLQTQGVYKTFHLGNSDFFQSLKKSPIIINTSRGEVIDTRALLSAMDAGQVTDAIIDVWENEPHIDRTLLERAFIATPHIAGYSADGKGNATRMSLEALCQHFKVDADFEIKLPVPTIPFDEIAKNESLIPLIAYNPTTDSDRLKAAPEQFEEWRNNYPVRRETALYYEAWQKVLPENTDNTLK